MHPPLGRLLLHGISSILPLLPFLVAAASSVPFPLVKGCGVEASYARVGDLIAHSNETLYMGVDDRDGGQRLVVAIPMGRLEEALIASNPNPPLDPAPDLAPRCDPVAGGGGSEGADTDGDGGGGGFGGGDFGGGGAGGDW